MLKGSLGQFLREGWKPNKKISCCPWNLTMFLMHSSLVAFQHQYSNTKDAATIKSRSSELNCQLPGRIRFLAIYSTVKNTREFWNNSKVRQGAFFGNEAGSPLGAALLLGPEKKRNLLRSAARQVYGESQVRRPRSRRIPHSGRHLRAQARIENQGQIGKNSFANLSTGFSYICSNIIKIVKYFQVVEFVP